MAVVALPPTQQCRTELNATCKLISLHGCCCSAANTTILNRTKHNMQTHNAAWLPVFHDQRNYDDMKPITQKHYGCLAYATSPKIRCRFPLEMQPFMFFNLHCVAYAQQPLCVRKYHRWVVFVLFTGRMAAEHSCNGADYRHPL